MSASRALVLAAGVGSRLMPLTKDRPKALVDVAGASMLEGLLRACAEVGIDEAIVVTGYKRHDIEAWLRHAVLPIRVRTVFNEAYETRGNAWSLACARELLDGAGFVKLDGDLVLEPALLAGLLASPWASAAALDTRAQLDAEAMKARVRDDRVTAMGKWLPIADSAGESIGVEKIAAADAPLVFEAVDELMREGALFAYYEDAYHRLLGRGWQLGAWEIGALRWSEIDDAADLERARTWLAEERARR